MTIQVEDGTVESFPGYQTREAFLNAVERAKGNNIPEHPLCSAARRSRDPKWRTSAYVMDPSDKEIEDLSG